MTSGRLPNIVLIVVDTLRGDHVSCYGHERRTTPHLDTLAADATLYTTATSPGAWTPPSHASIFTGTYPSRHGVDRSHPYLDGPLTTLPEYLRERGYRTYGISSNFWISTATHYDRGFDVFYQSWQLAQTRSNPALERQRRRDPSYVGGADGLSRAERARAAINRLDTNIRRYCCRPFVNLDMGARRVNRVVRRWMRHWMTLQEPFFAFIHYMEPHLPYRPPARFLRQYLDVRDAARARDVNQKPLKYIGKRVPMTGEDFELLGRLYDAEISYTDHCIGEVVDGLRASGLLDNTMLVFCSDHGENLGDHGLMDHMFSVHDSITTVPLIVRYPGETQRGTEHALVQTLDIFPTVASLVGRTRTNGMEAVLAGQFQGGPLPPFGSGRQFAVTELLQVQPPIATLRRRYPGFDWGVFDRSLCALRTATHKYVQGSNGTEELYAIATDPRETTNQLAADHARAAEMRAQLNAWRDTFAPVVVTDSDPEELDGEIRRRLEDLGYIEA